MSYSTYLAVTLATLGAVRTPAASEPPAEPSLAEALQAARQRIDALVEGYRHRPVTPLATARFETELGDLLRALGQAVLAWTYNHLEPADTAALPPQVECAGDGYRRLAQKTPQTVDTLFGPVRLWRLGYRAAPSVGAPVLFPLCLELGVVHGTTPALCERVSRYLAETGATQQVVLKRLRQEQGVRLGVKRLRALTAFVATALEEHRGPAQAEQVVRWLAAAHASSGRHRPVLAAGRDGITLGLRGQRPSFYEVASAGTLTVYDRRGRRLGTVYLGYVPEPGQTTMTQQLTALLRHRCGGQRDDVLPKDLAPAAASGDRPAVGVAVGGGLLPCVGAVDELGRGVVRQGAAGLGLDAKDAEVTAQAGWCGPSAALGGSVAATAAAAWQAAARFPARVPVYSDAASVPGLCGVPALGHADRQWCDGSGVQDAVHATSKTVRDALG
jgi:hypothetical protein